VTELAAIREIADDGTVTMRTIHFPPIYRAHDLGWMACDCDEPNPRRVRQRAARRVRMARKKRRGYA
jgi:hypothetical protein